MTHSIRHLPVVDNIIVLKDGRVSEVGSYDALVKRNGEFAEFLNIYMKKTQEEEEDESSTSEEGDREGC